MRTLKFRIWDVKEEKMLYDSNLVFLTIDGRPHFWTGDNCIIQGKSWPHELFVLQQFTGLLDCEGKEIYEGDILKISNGERLVADLVDVTLIPEESRIVWLERSRMGEYYGSNSDTSWYSLLDYDVWEVIGNKMQNPELLKQ